MVNTTPKQAGFIMPAEWHPHERCWMAWPCHQPSWSSIGIERARRAYADVARAIAQYEPLILLANPEDLAQAQQYCGSNITVLPLAMDDSWLRDTGPTFLINSQRQLGGVDWIHNAWGGNYSSYDLDQKIAGAIIEQTQAQYFHAPLVMEGGAFHTDGEGTILTSRECLLHPNRNPHLSQQEIEGYLCDYLGAERVIWLNKGLLDDETDGHVDEIATFIAPGMVLCLITEDKTDPNYDHLQENLAILQEARDAKGRALKVYTVDQPPETLLKGARLTLSYINFYRANNGIVMPSFNHDIYDQKARNLFQQLFPNYQLTQVPALDIFAGGGGIHCITQQQPRSIKLHLE